MTVGRPPEDRDGQLRWLVDRAALKDLATEYCWMVDSRDWDGWADLFLPEGGIVVPAGTVRQERLAEYAGKILAAYPRTSHQIANFSCEIDGDRATTRAAYRAVHVSDPEDLTKHADQVGVYLGEARKVDGSWRYLRIKYFFVALEGEAFAGLPAWEFDEQLDYEAA